MNTSCEADAEPAWRLLRGHWEASDYTGCVQAAAALHLPARLDAVPDLPAVAAAAVAAGFDLLAPEAALQATQLVERGLAGEADSLLDTADAGTVMAWCTALAEWCERHGLDAPFARLAARAARADAAAPPRARVHWRIASAWHHESFGRFDRVGEQLLEASTLAAASADVGLNVVVALKQARLALARAQPAEALIQAAAVAERLVPGGAPLWWADLADIRARAALAQGDAMAALHHARLCDGLAHQARATPAYTVTYRVNEAYALLGLGATEEAVSLVRALAAAPMPARMQQRVALLERLFVLAADDRAGHWGGDQEATLRAVVLRLRELAWTGALALLPAVVARLWARALDAGIETDWVRAAITSRTLAPPEASWPDDWPWALKLRVLGAFDWQVTVHGAVAEGPRAASKPLELLRRLAAEAGLEPCATEALALALWPGQGRDGRDKALETTLARLRRLLGDASVLRLAERRLRLDPQRVWLDREALLRRLAHIDAVVASSGPAHPSLPAQWQAALALWRGPLLADEGDDDAAPEWLRSARTRLRQRMASSLLGALAVPGHAARCLHARAADPGLAPWLVETPR